MTHKELIQKIKPGTQLSIKNEKYIVKQHIVWHQAIAGYPYDKYVLEDETGYQEYRLFISGKDEAMGMGKIFQYDFEEPIPEKIEWEGKSYTQTNGEFCTIIDIEGTGPYKAGDSEFWWDYDSEDGKTSLSLGRSWETWEREDLLVEYLKLDEVEITYESSNLKA